MQSHQLALCTYLLLPTIIIILAAACFKDVTSSRRPCLMDGASLCTGSWSNGCNAAVHLETVHCAIVRDARQEAKGASLSRAQQQGLREVLV